MPNLTELGRSGAGRTGGKLRALRRAALRAGLVGLLGLGGLGTLPAQQRDQVCATYFRRDFVARGFTPDRVRYEGLTHIYYMGPTLNFGTGEFTTATESTDLVDLRARSRAAGVKVIGTVLGGAPAFDALKISARRATMVNNLVRWYRESRLDGIDVDFEHPRNTEDVTNYSTFLQELRAALGPRAELSSAVCKVLNVLSISPAVANESMDRINVMSYDFPAAQHSAWQRSIDHLNDHISGGMTPGKLSHGVPFYGWDRAQLDSTEWAFIRAYWQLVNDYRATHGGANPPPDLDQIGTYNFNGVNLIRRKARHASGTVGGVFTWILDLDLAEQGLSLYDAMVEGARQGQATLDGFEGSLMGSPGEAYTTSRMTLSPTLVRTGGTYGAAALCQFPGTPWNDVVLRSPTMAPFAIPEDGGVQFDLKVPANANLGVAYLYLYNANGKVTRSLIGIGPAAGWRRLSYLRSGVGSSDRQYMLPGGSWVASNAGVGFDWNQITGYQVLLTGGNAGTTVPAWTTTVVLDSVSVVNPGDGVRPVRLDADADGDGLADINQASGSSLWQDRFEYPSRTRPEMVYTVSGEPATLQWNPASFGATHRALRWTLNFSGAQWGTSWLAAPRHLPVALPPQATLHLELDVLQSMPRSVIVIDLLDSEGRTARFTDPTSGRTQGLFVYDLRVNQFTPTAGFDASQISGWRIGVQGTDVATAAFSGAMDVAQVGWGRLPPGLTLPVFDRDGDGDGLADAAEDRNLDGILQAGESRADRADSDDDGTDDGAEWLSGTDPNDPASRLVLAMERVTGTEQMMLRWPSRAGNRYQVQSSADLQDWQPVGGVITAAPATTQSTLSVPAAPEQGQNTRFYRVRLLD